uniref:UBC core domain-containing protein n=1 Tax=Junco hyemalis TaxID=40217 RepID=A0A8C5J437_JUNHY
APGVSGTWGHLVGTCVSPQAPPCVTWGIWGTPGERPLGHLCATCVPPVCHLCATCVPPVCHLCVTCVSPGGRLALGAPAIWGAPGATRGIWGTSLSPCPCPCPLLSLWGSPCPHPCPRVPSVTFLCPQGFYKGGKFVFSFKVGQGYPHDPPKVKCETMVYHPNIDLEGNVCLNILR